MKNKIKLLTIIGARPQIIKAAALSRAIDRHFKDSFDEIIVHTGQHYDENMSNVFFSELGIPAPQYNLNVGSGKHGVQTAKMITGIEELLLEISPDYIVLYGDTNSTLAGAIAASKLHIPVVHIEAGLRSFNRKMPEEINRVVCDHLSTLLFSPTATGLNNLIKEGFNPDNTAPFTPDNPGIYHCGDIMYDNSLYFSKISEQKSNILEIHSLEKKNYVLCTIHRPQNTDNFENLSSIFDALIEISKVTKVILPLHPRTKNILQNDYFKDLRERLEKNKNLLITPPVPFLDMINLEKNASLIITDSGGVQKEAYFFKNPGIVLRNETEWVEIVESGNAILCGADYNKILEAFEHFTTHKDLEYPQIFGDGNAAKFILQVMLDNVKD